MHIRYSTDVAFGEVHWRAATFTESRVLPFHLRTSDPADGELVEVGEVIHGRHVGAMIGIRYVQKSDDAHLRSVGRL